MTMLTELLIKAAIDTAAQKQFPIVEHLFCLLLSTGKMVSKVYLLPPSPGYESFFLDHGWNLFAARGMAYLTRRHAARLAKEAEWRDRVVRSIRFLAKSERQKAAILRHAELLLEAAEETTVLEFIFGKAGIEEFEFIKLLKDIVERQSGSYEEICDIANQLLPSLKMPRGPKISEMSAAHEFLLRILAQEKSESKVVHTWSHESEDFVDPATKATRKEFGDYEFNPQSAARRYRANPASI